MEEVLSCDNRGVAAVRRVVVGVVLALTWAMAVPGAVWPLSDRIIAVVNQDVITLSDLQEEVGDEAIRLRAKFSGAELETRLRQKEFYVLNRLIEQRLQLQEAQTKGFTVSEEDVDQALRQSPAPPPANDAEEAILRRQTKQRILLQQIRDFEVRRVVTVSDTEVAQYYRAHPEEFMESRTYELRQILLLADSDDDRVRQRAQAQLLRERLQDREAFAELALQYSGGPEAADGGVLGKVRHHELLQPIADAVALMEPGQMSQPIETSLGFHIIALDGAEPETTRPLEEVEQQIKSDLQKQRIDEVFRQWLADLKKKAFIRIKYAPLGAAQERG